MTASAKKKSPFSLGAAYAAKLSANDGAVEFEVGGAEFSMPSAAKWTEDDLKATATQSPFEVIRNALGKDDYTRLLQAAIIENAPSGFDFGMAQELLKFYMSASGLGAPGES